MDITRYNAWQSLWNAPMSQMYPVCWFSIGNRQRHDDASSLAGIRRDTDTMALTDRWQTCPTARSQLESDAVMRDQPNRSKTRFLRFQLLGIQHPLDLSICQHYNNTSFKRLVCYFRLTTIDNKSHLQLYKEWLPWVDIRHAMPIFQSENLNSK